MEKKKLLDQQLSSFARVEMTLQEYGEEYRQEAQKRLDEGRHNQGHNKKPMERRKFNDDVAQMANVSRETVRKVRKILDANVPDIILQHLRNGSMSISNGISFLALPDDMKAASVHSMSSIPPKKSRKTEAHQAMNRHIMKHKENMISLELCHIGNNKRKFVWNHMEPDVAETDKRTWRCDLCLATDIVQRMRVKTLVKEQTISICPDCTQAIMERGLLSLLSKKASR